MHAPGEALRRTRTWTRAHIHSHGMKNKWVTERKGERKREREGEREAGRQIGSYGTNENL